MTTSAGACGQADSIKNPSAAKQQGRLPIPELFDGESQTLQKPGVHPAQCSTLQGVTRWLLEAVLQIYFVFSQQCKSCASIALLRAIALSL